MADSGAATLTGPTAVKLKLAPLSQQANDAAIKAVREGYSNKVGFKASTAGSGQIFSSLSRGQLEASGYLGASRRGLEAGVEVTWDLKPK